MHATTHYLRKTLLAAPSVLALALATATQAQTTLVNSIDISTGRNHAAAANFAYSGPSNDVSDPYWQVTMVPTNTVGITAPFCAKLIDSTVVIATLPNGTYVTQAVPPTGCRWISVTRNPTSYPGGLNGPSGFFWTYDHTVGAPINGAKPIRFTRKFQVSGTGPQTVTVTLNAGSADDILFARVDAAPNTPIYNTPTGNVYYNATYSTTYTFNGPIVKTLQLSPGVHTLDIDVYDIAAHITSFAMTGTISSSSAVLYSNAAFGADTSCGGVVTQPCSLTDLGYAVKQSNPKLYTFGAASTPSTASVTWVFGDGTSGTYAPGQAVTHLYAAAGSYKVCAKVVTTGSGCPEVCMNLCVADTGTLGVQGPGSNADLAFELNNPYPNPASGSINVPTLSPAPFEATAKVLDVSGRVLLTTTARLHAGSDLITLPIGGLATGIYLVEVVSPVGRRVKTFSKTD